MILRFALIAFFFGMMLLGFYLNYQRQISGNQPPTIEQTFEQKEQ